ncbi:MAG: hypothetical protein KF878_09145 [Planctomycetes bacterium]|nr:hypothetical protein [Planctomycetota bacterium]
MRRPPAPSDYVPTSARDLPMRSFLSAVGVIGLAVASAALLGAQAHRPAPAPVAWVQPVAAQSVAPAATAAPAAERDYRADPLHLPVSVDPTTRVVVIGAQETHVDEAADDAPAARVESGADVLRVPPERLDEVIRVIGRDEGHRRYWLELVDGRVIEVDVETADAVQRAMPLRSSYSRE